MRSPEEMGGPEGRPDGDPFDRMTPRLGRLPAPLRSELDAARATLYDEITSGTRANGPFPLVDEEGRLLGPFAAMLANPVVGDALQQLGVAIRASTLLAAREREIAILEVARLQGSAYERWAHERVAASIGMTPEEIVALRRGEEAKTLSARETLVRRVVASLCEQAAVGDALFEDARTTLGRVAFADLVHLVGYYRLLASSLSAWEIPVPTGPTGPIGETPPTGPKDAGYARPGTGAPSGGSSYLPQ